MNQSTEAVSLPALANESGFICINLDYSSKWIMPLEDGLKFIEGLRNARLLKKGYNDEVPTISTLPPVSFEYISQEQLDAWNVQELLTV